jgi:hypothetical protein
MFHKVLVEVELPDGDYCSSFNGCCRCRFYITDDHFSPYNCCNLFSKIIKQFENNLPLKLYQCKKLDNDRICDNLINY